tara:strand:- start:148 stop:297 length:150 start_codon:yes stop_codon:yes gene_type:complete
LTNRQKPRDVAHADNLLKTEVLNHIMLARRTIDRGKYYASLYELGYLFE